MSQYQANTQRTQGVTNQGAQNQQQTRIPTNISSIIPNNNL